MNPFAAPGVRARLLHTLARAIRVEQFGPRWWDGGELGPHLTDAEILDWAAAKSDEELLAIHGIGDASVRRLRAGTFHANVTATMYTLARIVDAAEGWLRAWPRRRSRRLPRKRDRVRRAQ